MFFKNKTLRSEQQFAKLNAVTSRSRGFDIQLIYFSISCGKTQKFKISINLWGFLSNWLESQFFSTYVEIFRCAVRLPKGLFTISIQSPAISASDVTRGTPPDRAHWAVKLAQTIFTCCEPWGARTHCFLSLARERGIRRVSKMLQSRLHAIRAEESILGVAKVLQGKAFRAV